MSFLELLLLVALIVGVIHHLIVKDELKCRIADLEWDLGNCKDKKDLGKRRDLEIHNQIEQLNRDLNQYKDAAYRWESLYNERVDETLTLKNQVSKLQGENDRVFNDLEIAKSDIKALTERISEAKALLQ